MRGHLSVWAAVLAGLGGCAATPPPPAVRGHRGQAETGWKTELTAAERSRLHRTLIALADGHSPADPPVPASLGIRWSDLSHAVDAACDTVEMARVTMTQTPDRLHFTLKTIDDRPGELTLRRTADERVYEEDVRIGRFGDADLQERLVAAVRRFAELYGRKRSLLDD